MAHRYSHAPRPTAAPITFKLEGNSLTVDSGRKVDIVQLGAVEQVRLTYEARSFTRPAFQTKVRMKDGKTFKFSSLHWQSLVQADDQGPEYSAFVGSLLRAVAGANPQARFYGGRPPWVWWFTLVMTAGLLVAVAAVGWQAYRVGAVPAALLALGIGLVGVWQLEPMIRLNRPRPVSADGPPGELLP